MIEDHLNAVGSGQLWHVLNLFQAESETDRPAKMIISRSKTVPSVAQPLSGPALVAPADLQGSVVPEDPGVLVDLPLASMDPTGSGRQGLTDRHASMDLPNLVACALKCADAVEWNSVVDRRASMARCVDVDEGEWTGSEEEWRVALDVGDVVEDLMVDSGAEEWTVGLEDEAAVGSMDLLDAVGSMDLLDAVGSMAHLDAAGSMAHLDAAGSMALQDAVALVALMAPPDVVGSMDLLDVVVLMDLLDVVGSMDHRDVVGSMDLPDGVGSVGAVGLMDLHPRQRRNLHFVPYQVRKY